VRVAPFGPLRTSRVPRVPLSGNFSAQETFPFWQSEGMSAARVTAVDDVVTLVAGTLSHGPAT